MIIKELYPKGNIPYKLLAGLKGAGGNSLELEKTGEKVGKIIEVYPKKCVLQRKYFIQSNL